MQPTYTGRGVTLVPSSWQAAAAAQQQVAAHHHHHHHHGGHSSILNGEGNGTDWIRPLLVDSSSLIPVNNSYRVSNNYFNTTRGVWDEENKENNVGAFETVETEVTDETDETVFQVVDENDIIIGSVDKLKMKNSESSTGSPKYYITFLDDPNTEDDREKHDGV